MQGARDFLKLHFNKIPKSDSPWEIFVSNKNFQENDENQTRDLVTANQDSWPLSHEADQRKEIISDISFSLLEFFSIFLTTGSC